MGTTEWYLVENELMNNEKRTTAPVLPDGNLDEFGPFTGTLRFRCESTDHLAEVKHFLTARRAAALMGCPAAPVYLRAAAPIETSGDFPREIAITVEFVDDPGPAVIHPS